MARARPGRTRSRDSFGRLDLEHEGLTPLFDAHWITLLRVPDEPSAGDDLSWEAVTDTDGLARWETAWAGGDATGLFQPALLADPHCMILACRRAGSLLGGAIAYTADGVTGISNVFTSGIANETLWVSAARAVGTLRPGLPIVGYESGEDLATARRAGFTVLGPLRIWARRSAVA
jgi:hypothetical protein